MHSSGSLSDMPQAELHRLDVIDDFSVVVGRPGRGRLAGLEPQEFAHVGPRAFDPRAEHGPGRLIEQFDGLIGKRDSSR